MAGYRVWANQLPRLFLIPLFCHQRGLHLYPPLEGEGRPHRAKRSFVRCGRGGVICSSAAHPTPSRIALCATRADPPPPGEGKKERHHASRERCKTAHLDFVICDSPAVLTRGGAVLR